MASIYHSLPDVDFLGGLKEPINRCAIVSSAYELRGSG